MALNKWQTHEAIKLYKKGMTLQQVGDVLGLEINQFNIVRFALIKAGVPRRSPGNFQIPIDAYESIKKRYRSGESMPKIARTYGKSRQAIHLILKKLGVSGRKKKRVEINRSFLVCIECKKRWSIKDGVFNKYGVCYRCANPIEIHQLQDGILDKLKEIVAAK